MQQVLGYIRVKIDSDAVIDAVGDISTTSLALKGTPNRQAIELWRKSRYPRYMTTKQKVIQAVQGLPENASYEDAMERLLFLSKVERGLQQADAGQTVTHSKVKEKMKRWLK